MSAKTKNDPAASDQFVAMHEKKELRAEASRVVAEGVKLENAGRLMIGQGLVMAESTYTASKEDREAFKTWAVSVTHRSWKTCESYMAVAVAAESFGTKAEKEKAANLTFELGQVIAATPKENRREVLRRISNKTTTPTEAREIRDEVAASLLSDEERKSSEKEKATREKEKAAEKTARLIEDIAAEVKKAARKADPFAAMADAVLLVSGGRKAEDVAAAIRRIGRDVAATERLIAEQAKAEAEAGKTLAAIKESRES